MGDRSPKYNRVLLKLSGEALGGARDYGIDLSVVQTVAGQVKAVHEMGVQIALVVGGAVVLRLLGSSLVDNVQTAADLRARDVDEARVRDPRVVAAVDGDPQRVGHATAGER